MSQGKKRAVIVKIFAYLGGIVFVSFQAYTGETSHCLNEFDCLTLPNSLVWKGRGLPVTKPHTSISFYFTTPF